MSNNDINEYVPSLLNPRCVRKNYGDISLTQNSIASRFSLSLRRNTGASKLTVKKPISVGKENSQNVQNFVTNTYTRDKKVSEDKDTTGSLGYSAIEDLHTVHYTLNNNESHLSTASLGGIGLTDNYIDKKSNSVTAISSTTELADTTQIYDQIDEEPVITVSFGLNNCKSVDISSNRSRFQRICVSNNNNGNVTNVDCEAIENSQISTESEIEENMNETGQNPQKRLAVAVNLEIKKKRLSAPDEPVENSKVLILNTNAIEKFSHVIVQPPNYKLVKRRILNKSKIHKGIKRKSFIESVVNNGKGDKLSQKGIDSFFCKANDLGCVGAISLKSGAGWIDDVIRVEVDMSKNSGIADAVKCERGRSCYKGNWRDHEGSPGSANVPSSWRPGASPRRQQEIKTSSSDAPRVPSPKPRNDSNSSHSPRGKVDSIQFSLPTKSKSNRTSITPRNIPHHKIVAGTHFAVDAFSYGDIPNVKHYFLTHFHSDHYSGLKKSFNKLLFCSKITADLCISRLGVSAKCIHVINVDETVRIEGVEVTAVEANHCPGAIMLLFTLPNGKTLLHTGDFRASPTMESYPIFWNKDIHTIYLDTTYCNPRYDFPTQDQSLEMALYILRQKKLALEKIGKKFSQVLIVCGTYTIGKEKFFLGMARRVGCTVWACPEKNRVLQTVEGRSFGHEPPHSCQLHVVPMRDLTHEKLRSYLDSLQGTFTEVVAFKPSGWENGKNSSVEKDNVIIHGIPYSEHSSFSEIIRFVKFLKPKQVVPTVDISGGVKAVQKYFPCPLVYKEDLQYQSKVTDYFSIHNRQQVPAVT